MGKLFTLVVSFFVSLLVGGMAQNAWAVWAKADQEFIAAIAGFVLLTVIASVVFGIALFAGLGIDKTARWLCIVVVALAAATVVASQATAGAAGSLKADVVFISYIVAPTLIMIAIQWYFVRRRALRDARGNVAAWRAPTH